MRLLPHLSCKSQPRWRLITLPFPAWLLMLLRMEGAHIVRLARSTTRHILRWCLAVSWRRVVKPARASLMTPALGQLWWTCHAATPPQAFLGEPSGRLLVQCKALLDAMPTLVTSRSRGQRAPISHRWSLFSGGMWMLSTIQVGTAGPPGGPAAGACSAYSIVLHAHMSHTSILPLCTQMCACRPSGSLHVCAIWRLAVWHGQV